MFTLKYFELLTYVSNGLDRETPLDLDLSADDTFRSYRPHLGDISDNLTHTSLDHIGLIKTSKTFFY